MNSFPGVQKQRNRAQLSCTPCRQSKLKCDRQEPCSVCIRKGRASSCTFPAPAVRVKPVNMQAKLRHLESLVKDVMAGQPKSPSKSSTDQIPALQGAAKLKATDANHIKQYEIDSRTSLDAQSVDYVPSSEYIAPSHVRASSTMKISYFSLY